MPDFEKRQMKPAMRESRHFFEEGRHGHERGGTSSQPCGAGIKRGPIRSFSIRERANISQKGIDPYMFPSKQKSIKSMFSAEGAKKVGKVISKFFLFNGIPFTLQDSGDLATDFSVAKSKKSVSKSFSDGFATEKIQ